MANLKNWQPEMSIEDRLWFDACPKAVLFAIAQQFAMRVGDDFSAEGALATMRAEWDALHANGLVPQKPFNVERKMEQVAAYIARRDAARAAIAKATA